MIHQPGCLKLLSYRMPNCEPLPVARRAVSRDPTLQGFSFHLISIIAEQSSEQLLAHSYILCFGYMTSSQVCRFTTTVTESEALNLQHLGSEVPVSQLVLQIFWIDITLQSIEKKKNYAF